MKIVAIIQARCGSSRFPNKIFADISGKPLIWHVVNRLKYSETIDEILIATTTNCLDDKLAEWADNNNIKIFRGNENNVLNRYYEASKYINADVIIRITADDPFKEPMLIDKAVNKLINDGADFVSNNNPPSYPEGLDVEVFTSKAIEIAEQNSISSFEREHVTQYFYKNSSCFKIYNISNDINLSYLRWTIDTDIDLCMVDQVYKKLYISDDKIFYMNDILALLKECPEIEKVNNSVSRSEMYK